VKVIRAILMISLMLVLARGSMAQTANTCSPSANSQMSPAMSQPNQNLHATVQLGPIVRRGLPPAADVYIGSKFAMRIAAPAGGLSPMHRARIIAYRLNQAFAAGYTWQDERVVQMPNRMWSVTIGGRLIVTADRRTARAFGVSRVGLASRWARQSIVAMGGHPSMVALAPVTYRVAGSQQEYGRPGWSNTQSKSVPLMDSASGTQIGNIMVAGRPAALSSVGIVVLYSVTNPNGSTVRVFVPISGTSVSGNITRVNGVGVIGVTSDIAPTLMPTSGMPSGTNISQMVSQMGGRWNSMINSRLAQQNVPLRGASKVVPLYSMDASQVIGAAQIVGNSRSVYAANEVVASTSGSQLNFITTSAQPTSTMTSQPAALNGVVISALISPSGSTTPAPTAAPSGTTPQSAPQPNVAPAPAPAAPQSEVAPPAPPAPAPAPATPAQPATPGSSGSSNMTPDQGSANVDNGANASDEESGTDYGNGDTNN